MHLSSLAVHSDIIPDEDLVLSSDVESLHLAELAQAGIPRDRVGKHL